MSANTTVAISDNGRYAIRGVSTASSWSLRLYDLESCDGLPEGTTELANCPYRGIQSFLQQTFTGFAARTVKFITPELLALRVVKREADGTSKYYSVRLAPPGNNINTVNYLAMGDSFSSGEGAYSYELGTDENGERMWPDGNGGYFKQGVANKCHLSRNSYPYLISNMTAPLNDFRSIACSGATTKHYTSEQKDRHEVEVSPLGKWLPGYRPQREYLREASPSVVTITMGGNDIGFADIVRECVIWPDVCYRSLEYRQELAERVHNLYGELVQLYSDMRATSNNARVYVLGYPQIVNHGDCGLNVRLSSGEISMARGLVRYLNAVIKAATQEAGVFYVDMEDVSAGHQLCESGKKAVNGLTAGDDIFFDIGPFGNESYHPNAFGHKLMADRLMEQTDGLTALPEPVVKPVIVPYINSPEYNQFIADVPSEGPVNPQFPLTDVKSVQLRGETIVPRIDIPLMPNSTVNAEYHSTPTPAGTLMTNENGELTGEITVPDTLAPGYHTLHLYAKTLNGKDVDLYKIVYIAASEDDIDGDGIRNEDEKCLAVEPANIDEDQDGIDDACDPEIDEPPADSIPPEVVGAPDREPDADGWYKDNVTITWTVTDPEPSSGTPTQPAQTVADREGAHTYTSDESCDPLGNCATGSIEIKIDKTAPLLGPATWNCVTACPADSTVITIPVSDELSGVAAAEYFLGNNDPGLGAATPIPVENGVIRFKTNDLPLGTHQITIRAKDKVGNWSLPLHEYAKVYNLLNIKLVSRQQPPVQSPFRLLFKQL